jgi:hypothetical protein
VPQVMPQSPKHRGEPDENERAGLFGWCTGQHCAGDWDYPLDTVHIGHRPTE